MWGSTNDESMMGGYGGGFTDNNKTDSPGTGKKQGNAKRAQSVTPIVIGMVNNCKADSFEMWGNPTSILKIVCIVRKFDVTSTTVTYELEDHTGVIKAVLWLDHDATSEPNIPVDKENVYVKVFGTLRHKGDEKVIMILKIAPLESMNEITCHLLETLYVRFASERKSKGEAASVRANNPSADLANSMMAYASGMAAGMEEESMTPIQRNVFRYMKSANSDVGVNRQSILSNFAPNQKKDIEAAINFLVSEGHIFSTIDHDHFQVTTA